MISLYILLCCVIGLIAVALLKDRSALDHTTEYEKQEVPGTQAVPRTAMG